MKKLAMLTPTLVMAVIAAILLNLGWNRGGGEHITGIKTAAEMLIRVLPLLILAFIVAGMAQALLPREMISKWIGVESGWRGIIFGSIAGGITPGGPFVNLPNAAALLKAGASVGTLVAYLTGWSLWAVARLPLEVGILGWRFTMMRLASVAVLPPLAGYLAQRLFGGVHLNG